MAVTKRQMRYRILYFGVLGLFAASTPVVFIFAGWWGVLPALLAIAWVSPLTNELVDRGVSDEDD